MKIFFFGGELLKMLAALSIFTATEKNVFIDSGVKLKRGFSTFQELADYFLI
jgi:hypothetical protein